MSYRHSAPSHALHTAGLYLALLAALCLTACTRPADVPELDTADSLMEQRPDSALALLRRIDTLRLTSRHDRARYAMLLSMALDKNYIDLKDFHVLQPAITRTTVHPPNRCAPFTTRDASTTTPET